MNKQEYIESAEQELLHTYNRFSLVLDHGKGVYLYDTDGKEYLDFAAGIAVCAFGYGNEEYGNVLIGMTGTFLFLAVAETFILGKNGVIALLIRTYMGG